ncbi:hypothetical protein NL676_002040 [Syzygium grande]|nr:hypothetical protein NL676_002040 [Syzygium grande]
MHRDGKAWGRSKWAGGKDKGNGGWVGSKVARWRCWREGQEDGWKREEKETVVAMLLKAWRKRIVGKNGAVKLDDLVFAAGGAARGGRHDGLCGGRMVAR